MTNVYTRKFHLPKTISMQDYRKHDVTSRLQHRLQSPTRRGIPHPSGLNRQNIPSTSTYLIWNPDFSRKYERYPSMLNHMRQVNFSCAHPLTFDYVKNKGQFPTIHYTENTISRQSYANPARFPALRPPYPTTRFGNCPNRRAVTGIVPTLIVPEYLPVIER